MTQSLKHRAAPDDVAFRQAFEAGQVSPSDFNHAAHVRLAYVYLCDDTVEHAAGRMKSALLSFIRHHGINEDKYHETLTRAWVMAVDHFMRRSTVPADSAASFMRSNPALLDSKIMLTHYSAQLLFSGEARAAFVPPDLQEIPPREGSSSSAD
jgi:hypothetical protein